MSQLLLGGLDLYLRRTVLLLLTNVIGLEQKSHARQWLTLRCDVTLDNPYFCTRHVQFDKGIFMDGVIYTYKIVKNKLSFKNVFK